MPQRLPQHFGVLGLCLFLGGCLVYQESINLEPAGAGYVRTVTATANFQGMGTSDTLTKERDKLRQRIKNTPGLHRIYDSLQTGNGQLADIWNIAFDSVAALANLSRTDRTPAADMRWEPLPDGGRWKRVFHPVAAARTKATPQSDSLLAKMPWTFAVTFPWPVDSVDALGVIAPDSHTVTWSFSLLRLTRETLSTAVVAKRPQPPTILSRLVHWGRKAWTRTCSNLEKLRWILLVVLVLGAIALARRARRDLS